MRKIILGLAFALGMASCDDYLDVDVTSTRLVDDFYSSEKQMQQALLGVYNGLLDIPYYNFMMSDIRSGDLWAQPSEDKQRDYVDITVFNPNIYTIDTLNDCWVDLYEIVARANLFLEEIEDIDFTSSDDVDVKSIFKAEARFLRALAYFDLVRYFGRVPISTKSLTVDEAGSIGQSEPEEVYEQVIIPDLQYAIENMLTEAYEYDGSVADAGRATLPAAKALLGRVYLTMSGYPLYDTEKADLAADVLKEVIDYAEEEGLYWASTGDEWPHIWISDNDNMYHIFEVQFVSEKNYGNTVVYYMVNISNSDYINIKMGGYDVTCANSLNDVFNLYNGYTDVRFAYTFDEDYDWITKFFEHNIKRTELGYSTIDAQIVDRTYFPINYPLIRLEDVMLMYAEIVGPTSEGIRLVNKIRTRAGLPELTSAEQTSSGFFEAVVNERRRELAAEGIRWHDEVRHYTYIDDIQSKFIDEATDEDGNITTSSYLNYANNVVDGTYIYPIPDTQMKAKEGLYTQNEAYK